MKKKYYVTQREREINIFKIISLGCVFMLILCGAIYYVLPLFYYDYPVHSLYLNLYIFIASVFIILVLIILLIATWKNKISTIILFSLAVISILGTGYGLLLFGVAGINGYSITTDVNNYLKSQWTTEELDYFPTEITSDMKDVKYGYFFRSSDIYSIEVYLEVTVEDEELLLKYVSETLDKVGLDKTIQSINPGFKAKYITFIKNGSHLSLHSVENKDLFYYSCDYFAIHYSTENKTIIWSLCIVRDTYTYEYESFLFKKFNIKFDEEYGH